MNCDEPQATPVMEDVTETEQLNIHPARGSGG